MTKAEIKTLVTSLLSGIVVDDDLFTSLLDIAQAKVEGLRPWVVLRAEDATQTFTPSDSYTTAKTLPADFREWYSEYPIQLLDSQSQPTMLLEIPFAQRFAYKDTIGRFCVDYKNSLLYLMGTPTQGYTVRQSYIQLPTLVSSADSATWVFPSRFNNILALYVSVMWKLGVDYDIINNSQANDQAAQANALYDLMSRWDSNLQASMQRGIDPFSSEPQGFLTGTNIY